MAKFGVTTFIAGLSYDNPGLAALYDFFDSFEPEYRKLLLAGAGKGLSYFYSDNTKEDIYRFVNHLKAEDRSAVLKTMESGLKEDRK